jgi:hypothetical protein
MSVFSRINTELNAVKKLASIAHLGNGISIDAAKSLISKQLGAVTSGLTGAISGATSGLTGAISGATSGLTGAITTATKLAGVATTVAKITGGNLSSGVSPAPVVFATKPVITLNSNKTSPLIVYADEFDAIAFDWNIVGATTFTVEDRGWAIGSGNLLLASTQNPGSWVDGKYAPTGSYLTYNKSIQSSPPPDNTITVTARNSVGTTTASLTYSVIVPPKPGDGKTFTMSISQSGPITESQSWGRTVGTRAVTISGGPPTLQFFGQDRYFFQPPEIDNGPDRVPGFSGRFDSSGTYTSPWRSGRHVGSLQVDYVGKLFDLKWDFIVEGPDGAPASTPTPTPTPTVYTPIVTAGTGGKLVISGGKPGASYSSSYTIVTTAGSTPQSGGGTFDSTGSDFAGPGLPSGEYVGTLTSNGVTISFDVLI